MPIYVIYRTFADHTDSFADFIPYPVEYPTDLVQAKWRKFILEREVKIYEERFKDLVNEYIFIRELQKGPTVGVKKK